MTNQKRLEELIEKGKRTQLNNQELLEIINLIGPDKAIDAIRKQD